MRLISSRKGLEREWSFRRWGSCAEVFLIGDSECLPFFSPGAISCPYKKLCFYFVCVPHGNSVHSSLRDKAVTLNRNHVTTYYCSPKRRSSVLPFASLLFSSLLFFSPLCFAPHPFLSPPFPSSSLALPILPFTCPIPTM